MNSTNAANQSTNDTGRPVQLELFTAEAAQNSGTPVVQVSAPRKITTAPPVVRPQTAATVPPSDLRAIAREIRARFRVHGQDDAVNSISVLAALHVAGGMRRGGRPIIVGPSGCGKTTLLRGLADAIADWGLPVATVDAIDLTGPGWGGAPSISDVIEASWRGRATAEQQRRMLVVIDEIHHARVDSEAHGNMAAKQREVLASFLSLTGGGRLQIGESGGSIETDRMLVVCAGAFTGMRDDNVTVDALVRYGIPLELATRFDQIVRIRRLHRRALVSVLKQHDAMADMLELCARLGIRIRIHEQTFTRAACAVEHDQSSTPRTAVGWIVTAFRAQLYDALFGEGSTSIELSPDSLDIPYARDDEDHGVSPGGESGVV